MRLATARQRYEDVTAETVEEVFADDSLRGEFIILEAEEDAFLQAGGEGDGPYTLDYREAGKQFRAMGELTRQEVTQAFLDYLRGGSAWHSKHEWQAVALQKGCLKQAAALLLLVGVIAWALIP
jgi:hypothetical protein